MRIETRLVSLTRAAQETSMTMNYKLESLEVSLMSMKSMMDNSDSDLADQRDWWMFSVVLLTFWLASVLVAMMCLHLANFRYHHLTVS
jgi:hypothetical protein